MGTVTYTSIFNRIKALAGIPSPDANAQAQIVEFVNRRARMAYEATDFWPRWLVAGELRNYQSTIVNATSLVVGYTYTILTAGSPSATDWISVGASSNAIGTTFIATGAGTGNGTATWNSNIIPFAEAGKDTIDKFIRIHKIYQPFYIKSSAEVEFYVTGYGASIIGNQNSSSASAYVTYKKDWDGPYTSISTNIPEEWQEYISHAAYADWLRSDGKNDVSLAEETFASNLLDQELGGVDVTRSVGVLSHRISTNISRSFRSR